MGVKNPRKYTDEFRQQAAELAMRIGVTKAARQLGVNVQNVQRWKQNAEKQEPQAKKVKLNVEDENRRLQRENEELRKVNQILKRAAAFFSQDHLK